jgi:hypothetical protein
MRIAALVFLSFAVFFGAMLIIPGRAVLRRLPRRIAAATHGLAGATGLGLFFWATMAGATQATWFAIGLLTTGLIAGLAIFVTCRHRRMSPALILALHIIFAGMGYMLCVGLILS